MRSLSVIYTVLLVLLFSGTIFAAAPIAENLSIAGYQSTDNLSASWDVYDGDADDVRNFTVWSLNGNELPVLYVPFEGSSNTYNATDYAGDDNGATSVSGAIYNSSGGYDGYGAYEFSTNNDVVNLATTNFPAIGSNNYTLMVWFKTAGAQETYAALFSINLYSPGFYVYNQNYLGIWHGGLVTSSYNDSIDDGTWHHAAFVREGAGSGDLKFYLDGRPLGTGLHSTSIPSASNLRVGFDGLGNEDFYGTIDDVRFYDYALSAEQVAAFAANESNKIVSGMTKDGQNWSMCVTPNDGGQDGTPSCSSNTTIGVSPFTPISGCQDISGSGEYVLTKDLDGANITGGGTSCLKITAADVTINCDGYKIENNGTGGTTNGILVDGKSNVSIYNCSAVDGYTNGIKITDSDQTLVDPSSFCNNGIGIFVNRSNNTNVLDAIACNNTQYGILVHDSINTTINDTRMYNNSLDFNVNTSLSSPNIPIELNNVTFDNPAGDWDNYSIIDIDDTLTISNEEYYINWTPSPSSPPNSLTSIRDGYVAINATSTMSIDTIVWHWTTSEGSAFKESTILAYGWNGTDWDDATTSRNVVQNTVTATNLANESVYGLFGFQNILGCVEITSSGSYFLGSDIATPAVLSYGSYQAPLGNVSPTLEGGAFDLQYSCIIINASNVDLDCQGFEIDWAGTGSVNTVSAGIAVVPNKNNISIINCPNIQDFGYSVYFLGNRHVHVENVSSNMSLYGFTSMRSRFSSSDCQNHTYINVSSRYAGFQSPTYQPGAGVFNLGCINSTYINSTAYQSGDIAFSLGIGLRLRDSRNLTVSNFTFHTNDYDLKVRQKDTTMNVNMTDLYFLPPGGSYENYTWLDLHDDMSTNTDEYTVSWWNAPAVSEPGNNHSFHDKYIRMVRPDSTFTPTIEEIRWHYTQDEVTSGAFDESTLKPFSWNTSSSWNELGYTYEPIDNEIWITDYEVPSGSNGVIYGILGAWTSIPTSTCTELDRDSREYLLTSSLSGTGTDPSPLSGSACIKVTAPNIVLDCDGYSITGATQPSPALYGILAVNADNFTMRNCNVYGYTYGIYFYSTENSTIDSNYGQNPYSSVYYIDENSHNNTFINNDVRRTSIGTSGYRIRGDQNKMFNNTAYFPNGIYVQGGIHGVFGNNTVNYSYSSSGFYNVLSYYNIIENNTFHRLDYGMYFLGGNSNNISNNTIFNTTESCMNITDYSGSGSLLNRIYQNDLINCGSHAIDLVDRSNGNDVFNNTITDVPVAIRIADNSDINEIYDHTINDAGITTAIEVEDDTSNGNTIRDNTITNIPTGVAVNSARYTTIEDNTISGASTYAIHVTSANLTNLSKNHLYNNNQDLYIYNGVGGIRTVYMDEMIFDNPAGNFQNYSNISMVDQMSSSSNLLFKWTANSSSPPYTSFRNKFVDISSTEGTVSIGDISFQWKDSEETGYDEAKFEVWKYNGTWSKLTSTIDTLNNNLSVTGLTPDSEYGILEGVGSGCRDITVGGIYPLNSDASGAPYAVPDISYVDTACIRIRADDVRFSCNGYSVSNTDAVDDAAAIAVYGNSTNRYTNVTIENCGNISGYEVGIALHQTTDNIIRNLTIFDISGDISEAYGIWAYNTSDSQLYNLTINTSAWDGIRTSLGTNNTIHDNYVHNNTRYGLSTIGGSGFSIYENNLSRNGDSGLNLNTQQSSAYDNLLEFNDGIGMQVQSDDCNISSNIVRHSVGSGYYLFGDNMNATNNTAWNNSASGFRISGANMSLSNGTAYRNQYGLDLIGPDNVTATDIHLYNNTEDVYISGFSSGTYNYVFSNVTIDRDQGDFQRETRIYVTDSLTNFDESFTMDHAVNPGSTPTDRQTFDNKYVNITPGAFATVSIDSIAFKWDDGDVGIANEANLELWKWNGSWSNTGATLSTANNNLSLSNMNPASDYAIFENVETLPSYSVTGCVEITSVGIYNLTQDIHPSTSGFDYEYNAPWGNTSPTTVGPSFDIDDACIIINSSNVVLDCKDYEIDWDTTSFLDNAAAIAVVPAHSEITIQNCPNIQDFEFGVYLLGSDDIIVENVTVNDSKFGFTSSRTRFSSSDCENHTYINAVSTNAGVEGPYYEPGAGFLTMGCINSTYINSTAHGSGSAGTGSSTYNGTGIKIDDPQNITSSNLTFYNNDWDLRLEQTTFSDNEMNLSDLYFLPDSGALSDYTRMSIYDHLTTSGLEYYIDYSSGVTYPVWLKSFENKYVELAYFYNGTGAHHINSTTFHYTQPEVDGEPYNESLLDVYRFNDWLVFGLTATFEEELDATLNTGSNTLTLTDFTPSELTANLVESTLGIMEEPIPITGCQNITSSGRYRLTSDLSGTQPGRSVCIDIQTDDVVLFFDGHFMSGDPGIDVGIYAFGRDNLTIKGTGYSSLREYSNIDGYTFGAWIWDSRNVDIDPIYFCDNEIGVLINQSNNTLINDTIACNNTDVGFYVLDSDNVTFEDSRAYNNSVDFRVNNTLGVSTYLNMTSLIFDRPQGDNTSFTNMTVNDSVAAGEAYQINWTTNSAGLPAGYSSFADKFVEITNLTSSVSIDEIIWRWNETEISTENESNFELWKYNGSWSDTSATLDTGNNTLTLTNMNPASDYGILEGSDVTIVTDCTLINAPGNYVLGNNISGAPYYIDPSGNTCYTWSNKYVCIHINSSNVELDCAGYTIQGDASDGTTPASGVYIGNDTGTYSNITVKNCDIRNYTGSGIFYDDVGNGSIFNNTINGTLSSGEGQFGIFLNANNNVSVYDNFVTATDDTSYQVCHSENNSFYNNTAYLNYVGFKIDRSNDTSMDSNNATIADGAGFIISTYLMTVNNNNLTNNYATDNSSGYAYNVGGQNDNYPVRYTYLENNTMNGSGTRGYYFNYVKNSTIRNNTARNSAQWGYYFDNNNEHNVLEDNLAEDNPYAGFMFLINFNYNNVTNNTARYANSSSYSYSSGFLIYSTSGFGFEPRHNRFENNTAEYNDYGFYLFRFFSNNSFINNTVKDNDRYYFYLNRPAQGETDCVFENNTLIDTIGDTNDRGFYSYYSSNNTYRNNNITNIILGYYLSQSNSNDISGGQILNATSYSVQLSSSSHNDISGLYMVNQSRGFYVGSSCVNNTFSDSEILNTSTGSATYAVYLSSADNNSLRNITIGNSTGSSNGYGFYLSSSNETIIEDSRVYGARTGARIYLSTNEIINISNVTFDSPSGNYMNYSTISLNDSVPATTGYTINWTSEPPSPPKTSFRQKFVNITTVTGTPSIDGVVWHWDESELAGYTESGFELWKYNSSGWNNTGATLDTGANTLTLTNLNPASDYGILEGTPSTCMLVNVSGSYSLKNDVAGAPIAASEAAYLNWACIKIATDDVIFDCDGYSITNNGTADAGAIVANSSVSVRYDNITIRNCPNISDYEIGIHAQYTDNSIISNNMIYNSTDGASSGFGMLLSYSYDMNLTDNIVNGSNGYGMRFRSGQRNRILNNVFFDNRYDAFEFGNTNGTIVNNTAYNSEDGFTSISGSNNTMSNNTAYNNTNSGISTNTGNSVFFNNTLYGNEDGLRIGGTSGSSYTNSTIFNNSRYGFYASETDNNRLEHVHFYNNGYDIYWYAYNLVEDINATNLTFDNPSGGFANYTRLDFNASLDGTFGKTVSFNWTTNSSALPADHFSFAQKFINITNHTPDVSLGSIAWRWDDSELGGYDESKFELWKYNGSWSDTGATLDTTANALSLTSFNPASDYGILEDNGTTALTNCPVISSPGVYTMTEDFYGAPNDVSELGAGTHRACVKIVSSDVVFDCNGYTIDENNTVDTTQTYGVLTNGSNTLGVLYTNVTVQNCDINGYMVGAYIRNTRDSFVLYNNITNATGPTTKYGIRNLAFNFSGTTETNNLIAHNRIWDMGEYGISSSFSGNCTFYNNTIWNFDWNGIAMGDNYQNITGNYVHSGGGSGPSTSGFEIQSSYGIVHNNTARNVSGDGFTSGGSRTLANFTSNLAYNNSGDGFEFNTVNNYRIINNTAHDNGREGFFVNSMLGGSDHYLYNNTAENNTRNGFHLQVEVRNVLERNRAFNNSLSGILLNGSQYANLSNNTALENGQHGFALISYEFFGQFNSSDYARMLDNNATGNAMAGLAIINSSHAFVDPSYLCNNLDGIVIYNATNITVQDNVLCNNTGYGMNISESNVTHTGNSLYNNGHDFVVEGTSIHNMSGNLFLNPAGTLANYTNLSINDSVTGSYTINWTANSSSLPADYISFEQKYLNISTVSGTPSIDTALWSWTDTEAGSYDESKLELWKWNGSWTNTSATLNTGSNTLTLTNMNPASDYGILQNNASAGNNITACTVITASGFYQLAANLEGAPHSASPLAGTVCVKIAASNVEVDCNGYTITNNGTAGTTYGVLANGSLTNVVLRNCPGVSRYTRGVGIYQTNHTTVTNSTSYNNTQYGFYYEASSHSSFTRNTAYDNGQSGIMFYSSGPSSTNHTITDNLAHDNGAQGIELNGYFSNSTIEGNTAENNTGNGFGFASANYNNITNNTAFNNSEGFRFVTSGNNRIEDNNATRNQLSGYNSQNPTSSSNNYTSNIAVENRGHGFQASSTTSTRYVNNLAQDNTNAGFHLTSMSTTTMQNNNATSNNQNGFYLVSSTSNTLTGNRAEHNLFNGFILNSSSNTNTLYQNIAYNNTLDGYYLYSSTDNNLTNNTAYGHPGANGFEAVLNSHNNNFTRNYAYNNDGDGFYVFRSSGTRFVENMAYGQTNGFNLNNAANTVMAGDTAYSNTLRGVAVANSNAEMNDTILYNNGHDLYADSFAGLTLDMNNVLFLNPSGTYQNFTNLSVSDTMGSTETFTMNWTANSSALPTNYTSFEEKFINISAVSGTVSIDSITWSWSDGEVLIYNESQLELWKWNGSWSDTGATLNTGANTLSLANMNPASDYGILQNGTIGQEATLVGADVNETDHGRYNESGYAGNASTAGGNFTGMNLNSSQLTDRWAALYGTFDGTILLTDSAGVNNVYSWIWNASAGGVVCVTTNSTLSTFTVYPAAASDIDSAWSFTPTASDSAVNTFDQSNCTLDIGSTSIPNSAYADTGLSGGYITCAAKTVPTPAKQNLLFCAEIEEDGPIWNGDAGDFEVIVPTPVGIGTTETYYFYVNLD